MPFDAPVERCGTCGEDVQLNKLRLRSKQVFRCSKCSAKLTQLGRVYKTWPLASFGSLDQDA